MVIKRIDRKTLLDNLAWIATVVYLMLTCILSTETYGAVILLLCAAVVAVLAAIKDCGIIALRIERFHIQWLLFGLYALVSALWAMNFSEAVSKGTTIIELLLCMILLYLYYQDTTDIWQLYNTIKWTGFLLSLYSLATLGLNRVLQAVMHGKLLSISFANINTVSMAASFAVIIAVYELLYRKKNIYSVIVCIPCILIIAVFGTRKGLLTVVLGVSLLLLLRYSGRNVLKTAFSVAIVAVGVLILIRLVSTLPMFAGIMHRMDGLIAFVTGEGKVDSSTNVRNSYMQIGWAYFLKYPLFGVGIGSSGTLLSSLVGRNTYLHNNFIELLCCGGITGFLIYYSMFWYCGRNFFRHRNTEPSVKLGLVMVILFLAMDMARVTYYSKTTIFYVMVFFLHIKNLNKVVAENENKKII